MSGKYDIVIEQGSTFNLAITMKYSDGTPRDLTDWIIPGVSPRGQVRKRHRSDDPPLANFSFAITDAVNGKLIVIMTARQTAELSAGETQTDSRSKYVWDFEIENSKTGEVKRVLDGHCYVSPEVTR